MRTRLGLPCVSTKRDTKLFLVTEGLAGLQTPYRTTTTAWSYLLRKIRAFYSPQRVSLNNLILVYYLVLVESL